MTDVVVTVPQRLWREWIEEGDLPGEPWSGQYSYFWVPTRPDIKPGERVYVVAHGKLRGYAPRGFLDSEWELRAGRHCLVRRGGAVAVTLLEEAETPRGEAYTRPAFIRGFRGWRYRWWRREHEMPFYDWREP